MRAVAFVALLAATAPVARSQGDGISTLAALLSSKEPRWRLDAAQSLAKHGSKAWKASGALVKALGDTYKDIQDAARSTLRGIGQRATRSIAYGLKSSKYWVRVHCAELLATGPFEVSRETPAVVAALGASPVSVRRNAAKALARLGERGVGPLIRGLKKKSSLAREVAARQLGLLGTIATPELVRMLGVKTERHREVAAVALGFLLDADSQRVAIEPLKTALRDESPSVRGAAATALGSYQRLADSIAPELVNALGDDSARVRTAAGKALARLGGPAIRAIRPVLPTANLAAAEGLAHFFRALREKGLDDLLEALPKNEPAICYILGRVGLYASRARGPLQKLAAAGSQAAKDGLAAIERSHRLKKDCADAEKLLKEKPRDGGEQLMRDAVYAGNRKAMFLLAEHLRFTRWSEAYWLFHDSASRGYAEAQEEMGNIHKGEKVSMKWYLLAAKGGRLEAQYNVAAMYKEAEQPEEAVDWWEKAAQRGHLRAMKRLSHMHNIGWKDERGIKTKDKDAALFWARKAAMLGDRSAQRSVIWLVEKKDPVEAYAWSIIRAEGGSKYDKLDYKRLHKKLKAKIRRAGLAKAKELRAQIVKPKDD